MNVRPATTADAAAIADIGTETWHDTYDDVMGEARVAELTDDWYDPETIRDYFSDDAFRAYVATRELEGEGDEEVLGYAYSRPAEEADVWALPAVYVRPAEQGNGIGTALVNEVERDARDHNADTVRLIVLAANESARSFYEARGYQYTRERESATVAGTRELVYKKRL